MYVSGQISLNESNRQRRRQMEATQTGSRPTKVKIVERSSMFEQLNKLSEQISRRAYEIFERNGRIDGHDIEDWFKAESEILPPLQLRINETDDALTVDAETPEFSAEQLQVCLEPWRLTLSGRKEAKEERKTGEAISQAQTTNEFLRVIDLPSEIDSAKSIATLKNGHLELSLPKKFKGGTAPVKLKVA
jgi:HSP20 family protein